MAWHISDKYIFSFIIIWVCIAANRLVFPHCFLDCLFKVCPMNRYSAQRQFWKAKQGKHGNNTQADLFKKLQVPLITQPTDYDFLDMLFHNHCFCHLLFIVHCLLYYILQHAAELEQKQNDSENKKLLGEVVKYSRVIQVQSSFSLLINNRLVFLDFWPDI